MIKNENLCKQIKVEFTDIPDEECEILRKWIEFAVKKAKYEIASKCMESEDDL